MPIRQEECWTTEALVKVLSPLNWRNRLEEVRNKRKAKGKG